MMKCPYCGGRGWYWTGVGDNAYREECNPCGGKGRGHLDPWALGGIILLLVSTLITLGILHFSLTLAQGAEVPVYPEERSLKWFRSLTEHARVAMVAGAMATVGHVGMRCPEPITVKEHVARLQYGSALDLDKPWISVYFDIITARGCRIERDDDKEGA